MAVLDHDDGVRAEDMFRRAAFGWALSTKKLVETSAALSGNTKVAFAALADIEYARDLLDTLFVPKTAKIPAGYVDGKSPISATEVRECVSNLATRIVTTPLTEVRKTPFNARVEHRGADLSAPVVSKNGKMLWATVDCPACPAKATQRCQKSDGGFIEKPHKQRVKLVDQA